jgi:hypothetical protein
MASAYYIARASLMWRAIDAAGAVIVTVHRGQMFNDNDNFRDDTEISTKLVTPAMVDVFDKAAAAKQRIRIVYGISTTSPQICETIGPVNDWGARQID